MARFLNGLQFLARPMRLWMLFQSHIGRVSMSTHTLKGVKHGPHSPEKQAAAMCGRATRSVRCKAEPFNEGGVTYLAIASNRLITRPRY